MEFQLIRSKRAQSLGYHQSGLTMQQNSYNHGWIITRQCNKHYHFSKSYNTDYMSTTQTICQQRRLYVNNADYMSTTQTICQQRVRFYQVLALPHPVVDYWTLCAPLE
jgi:hypothetical protein